MNQEWNMAVRKMMMTAALFAVSLIDLAAARGEIISPPVLGSSPDQYSWRIDAPVVTVRKKLYPQIRFPAGASIEIVAGGAVQTGGHGNTWKRYVDPSGPNSGTLYHGLIKIEGITNKSSLTPRYEEGLVRIKD